MDFSKKNCIRNHDLTKSGRERKKGKNEKGAWIRWRCIECDAINKAAWNVINNPPTEIDWPKVDMMLAGQYRDTDVNNKEREYVVVKLLCQRAAMPEDMRHTLKTQEIARRACTTERTVWRILKRYNERTQEAQSGQ